MNNQFDELTKQMAQSVTRRQALKKFSVGLGGMALACFGLANRAEAATRQGYCQATYSPWPDTPGVWYTGMCMDINGCVTGASAQCPSNGTVASSGFGWKHGGKLKDACGYFYNNGKKCSFTV